MGYNRKKQERQRHARKQGKCLPRNVYELGILPLVNMPGSLVREIVERTEKSAINARNQ